jgi:hypothetical protein
MCAGSLCAPPPAWPPRFALVWRSLGMTEEVDDIQQRCRDVWGIPYVILPDDRKLELRDEK